MQHQIINSKDNALIKQIVKLANNKSYRMQQGLAVIYGQHLIEEAYKYELLDSVLILEDILQQKMRGYQLVADVEVKKYIVSDLVMKKINVLDSINEVVGIIRIPKPYSALLFEDTLKATTTVNTNAVNNDCIILDNIQDPGNLGTVLRTAMATGFKNIIISKNSVDVYNPKVLRASQGMQFGLSILCDVDVMDFISKYKGVVILTTPHTEQLIYDINLKQKIAFVFGNEGSGLSTQLLGMHNNCVPAKIPMSEGADSINVAMAATVCMFEALRQRKP